MDQALGHATRTVMLEPDFLEAHLLLAGLHDRAGRKEEAKREMELYTLFKPSQR
jgi:hypothetical protein